MGPVVLATLWSKENNAGVDCDLTWTGHVKSWNFENDIPCKDDMARSITINEAKKGTQIYLADKIPGGNFNDHLTIKIKKDIHKGQPYKITTLNKSFDDSVASGVYKEYKPCIFGCGLNGEMSYAKVTAP